MSPGRICLGCGRIIGRGRCPICGTTTARGYGGDWEKVRRQVLERDEYRCRLRLEGCTETATAVDHVVPMSKGGARLDPANLRSTCASCNARQRHRTAGLGRLA